MKRKIISLLIAIALCASMTAFSSGCFDTHMDSADKDSTKENNPNNTDNTDNKDNNLSDIPKVDTSDLIQLTDKDKNANYDEASATKIQLNNSSINCTSNGVSIKGSTATIISSGTYIISGKLNDGQIIVDVDKKEDVHMIFDDADITCSDSAPIYIKSADKTIITLTENSKNQLTDGENFTFFDAGRTAG